MQEIIKINIHWPSGILVEKGFVSSSLFLFIDNIVLSLTGWLFWIIIGKFTTTSNLGLSTYLFTLAAFFSGILLLGLEFSLLKIVNPKSNSLDEVSEKQLRISTFSTIIIFEISINTLFAGLLWFLVVDIYKNLDLSFLISTVLILLFTTLGTISRYGLMGILSTKSILVIDVLSTIVRLSAGLLLLYIGKGAFAIIFATVLQTMILATFLTYVFISKMGFRMGDRILLGYILKEGISNFPGKLSKMMIAPLSIILLGFMGMDASSIGIFFIALIITVAAASFATSIATISLTSSYRNSRAGDISFRFGLSLTAPVITVLISYPKLILDLISPGYAEGQIILVILSLAILPSITVFNLITRLNSRNDNKKLIVIGVAELTSLLVLFFMLVPTYHSVGAAISIFVSYVISALVGYRWLMKNEIIQLGRVAMSITIGILVGLLVQTFTSNIVPLIISPLVVIIANHMTGALKLNELGVYLKQLRSAKYSDV